MIKIEPLRKRALKEAVDLTSMVFPDEEEEPPGEELLASLHPQKLYKKYWVAIDDSDRVIGTVGLYCYEKDKNEAFWLGWFCVHPDFRRKRLGSRLLQFAISKAERGGKRFLRLDTSTDPNESAARKLYEKYGFRLIKSEPLGGSGLKKLYYELKL